MDEYSLTRSEAAKEAVPPQATVRVQPCLGCGQLPHGSITLERACLRAAVMRLRSEKAQLVAAVALCESDGGCRASGVASALPK